MADSKKDIIERIRWPVRRFGKPRCTFRRLRNMEQLTVVSYASIQYIRRLDEYFVIDSRGGKFGFRDPHPADGISVFHRMFSAILNRRIRVEYERVDDCGGVSVEEHKAMMNENISEHCDFWSEYVGIDELIQQIEAATTHEELIALFD